MRPYLLYLAMVVPGLLSVGVVKGGDGTAAAPGSVFDRAMQEARLELVELESRPAGGDGWGVSAILSIAALALAAGVTGWLAWRVRKHGWVAQAGKELRVVERLALGRHSVLVLVEISGRRVVLVEHAHGVEVVDGCFPEPASAFHRPCPGVTLPVSADRTSDEGEAGREKIHSR